MIPVEVQRPAEDYALLKQASIHRLWKVLPEQQHTHIYGNVAVQALSTSQDKINIYPDLSPDLGILTYTKLPNEAIHLSELTVKTGVDAISDERSTMLRFLDTINNPYGFVMKDETKIYNGVLMTDYEEHLEGNQGMVNKHGRMLTTTNRDTGLVTTMEVQKNNFYPASMSSVNLTYQSNTELGKNPLMNLHWDYGTIQRNFSYKLTADQQKDIWQHFVETFRPVADLDNLMTMQFDEGDLTFALEDIMNMLIRPATNVDSLRLFIQKVGWNFRI